MPLILPEGAVPSLYPLKGPEGTSADERVLVDSVRETSFRFEVLDKDETVRGELLGPVSGNLDWTANAAIKGRGTFEMVNLDQGWLRENPTNWLHARIRPWMTIKGYSHEIPLGVWIPSAPVETWKDTGLSWSVEVLDKCSLLDADVWENPATHMPETFSVRAGERVLDVIRTIIRQVDPVSIVVGNLPDVVSRSLTWDIGVTRLRIINDLLTAAGCFALWVDNYGRFQVTEYTAPYQRPPLYELSGAFEAGPTSVMGPDWAIDRDIFSIPNRFVAISQGVEESMAWVSTALNNDPGSPFSYASRGRWITEVANGVEATSKEALNAYAKRRLAALTNVKAKFDVDHLFMPEIRPNVAVKLVNPRSGVNSLATVSGVSVPLSSVGMCSTRFHEVTTIVNGDEETAEVIEDGA